MLNRPIAALLVLAGSASGCSTGPPVSPLDPHVKPFTGRGWGRPTSTTTWHWQLKGKVNTAHEVDLYDIDLFDSPTALIRELRQAGRTVICYFSAGSSEDWRPDYDRFVSDDIGEPLDNWPGERWLDIRSPGVHAIMQSRLDLAVEKGCHGVEPDNVDGYTNETGFDLSATDQLGFNRFLANEAHRRGLAVGLKNDGEQASALVAYFDFELNEECHRYDECDDLRVFIGDDKPVLNAEYVATEVEARQLAGQVCPQAKADGLRTLILPLELNDAFRVSCDD